MKRIIIASLVALTALGSVASADRYRGDRYRHDRQSYRQHSRQVVRPSHRSNYRPRHRVVRRPIYVQRPAIRYRYYNYAQRPAIIVENYPPMAGYVWIAGRWDWSGREWIWMPGHYQPDPAYAPYSGQYPGGQYPTGQYYDNSQYSSGGYYDQYGNWIDGSYSY